MIIADFERYYREAVVSKARICAHAGITEAHFKALRAGRDVELEERQVRALAEVLRCSPDDLLSERVAPRLVRVMGFVGAGAEIHPPGDGDLDEVEVPEKLRDVRGLAAVRVRGDSMEPEFSDGQVLFYKTDVAFDLGACVNRPCVVELADGRRFVKVLRPGSCEGRHTLVSYNEATPPMVDCELRWCSGVVGVK